MSDKKKSRLEMDEAELWVELRELEATGIAIPTLSIIQLRLVERLAVAVEGLDEAVRSIELGTVVVETAQEVRRRG